MHEITRKRKAGKKIRKQGPRVMETSTFPSELPTNLLKHKVNGI